VAHWRGRHDVTEPAQLETHENLSHGGAGSHLEAVETDFVIMTTKFVL